MRCNEWECPHNNGGECSQEECAYWEEIFEIFREKEKNS